MLKELCLELCEIVSDCWRRPNLNEINYVYCIIIVNVINLFELFL